MWTDVNQFILLTPSIYAFVWRNISVFDYEVLPRYYILTVRVPLFIS